MERIITVEQLLQGTVDVIPSVEFAKKLSQKRALRIKFGADPTAPDLHLGHAVVLKKLRQFQDAGHHVIFIVGDFTARIGDPTGRSKTRVPLTVAHIEEYTNTYLAQVFKILDIHKTTVRRNSEWLAHLKMEDLLLLCGKVTLARIIERDDFAKRLAEHISIGMHELLYPLMQGYDSVELRADIELGGTDQTFNLLMGRFLQEQYNQEPQVVITTPLLEGLDGHAKMSKTLGNTIGLAESPENAYAKLMSISDTLMWRYYQVLLYKTSDDITGMQQACASGAAHPMELKKKMAHAIVAQLWSPAGAELGQQAFAERVQEHDYSHVLGTEVPHGTPTELSIIDLLKCLDAIKSSSEGYRLIQAGAVRVDGVAINDPKKIITRAPGMLITVGKHRVYKLG